ncbi:MAG: LytTR family transcriptional regulator [Lachnospiraceae bacterium]|nr:LytTR family transcriptional regulator [Lachnospiraceae bacterium]
MRVEIKKDQSVSSAYVEIHCRDVTKEVARLKVYISNYKTGIEACADDETHIVELGEILYIESVDKRTFIYTEKKVFSTDKRLYELEELLEDRGFFRCSKSVIMNLSKVVKLKPEITRNILATLANGEVIVVSRRYAMELKRLIGIGD